MKLHLLAGVMLTTVAIAHADDWQHRAKEAISGPEPAHQPCVLYADRRDDKLHLRAPICFYVNGDVYTESYEGDLSFNGRKAGATHPAVPCAETIEGASIQRRFWSGSIAKPPRRSVVRYRCS
jgi:hypothetical protein